MLLTTVFFNFGRKKKLNSSFKNGHFSTISGHFFAIYISIFHKTEILMVILRCWTGLNHNWFKSCDTKRKWGDKQSVLSIAFSFRLSLCGKPRANRKMTDPLFFFWIATSTKFKTWKFSILFPLGLASPVCSNFSHLCISNSLGGVCSFNKWAYILPFHK